MDDQLADTISDQIDLTIRIGDPGLICGLQNCDDN